MVAKIRHSLAPRCAQYPPGVYSLLEEHLGGPHQEREGHYRASENDGAPGENHVQTQAALEDRAEWSVTPEEHEQKEPRCNGWYQKR